MHWLSLLLAGLVAGVIATLLTLGRGPGGFIVTGLIGITGPLPTTWGGGRLLHL